MRLSHTFILMSFTLAACRDTQFESSSKNRRFRLDAANAERNASLPSDDPAAGQGDPNGYGDETGTSSSGEYSTYTETPAGTTTDLGSSTDTTTSTGTGTKIASTPPPVVSPPTVLHGISKEDFVKNETLFDTCASKAQDHIRSLAALDFKSCQLDSVRAQAPRVIMNESDWLNMEDGYAYVLGANITLSNSYMPKAIQRVVLDGKNFQVSGLTLDRDGMQNMGLFTNISCSHIKNIRIDNIRINAFSAGILAGRANNSQFEQIKISHANVSGRDGGGLINQLYSSQVSDVQVNTMNLSGDISGNAMGGIAGTCNNSIIVRSSTSGNVSTAINPLGTAYAFAGGLVGSSVTCLISQSSSDASVSGYRAGGLTGSATFGTVVAFSNASGSINAGSGALKDSLCRDFRQSFTYQEYQGGLIAYASDAFVCKSSRNGAVRGCHQVGGLIGNADDETVAYASYATAKIEALTTVGGLIGIAGNVQRSFYAGNIMAAGNAGGLIGQGGRIRDAYARGNIQALYNGNSYGGLVGSSLPFVDNAFAAVKISDSGTAYPSLSGGLVGGEVGNQELIHYSFWDSEISGKVLSKGGVAKTTAELQRQSSFTAWDFNGIWEFRGGNTYPSLRYVTP